MYVQIWLGTFDSEQGAAHAVDAARKLLKCKKNRPPNCPCDELFVYSETIPASLNLTNLVDESMFKEVTVFVKRKAQEYAAGFSCSSKATAAPPPHSPSLREQLPSLLAPTVALPYQVGTDLFLRKIQGLQVVDLEVIK